MNTPRLLASTGPLFARPLDWALGVIADAGFDGAEVMVTQDPASQDPERLSKAAATAGIPLPVVHGPFLLLTRRVFGTGSMEKARRSLELSSAIGADLMIVHPPFRWRTRFHHWLLEEADDEATELGTRIGVENLYPIPIAGRSIRLHRYTRPQHLTRFRNVVFDTSHFGVADVDILDAWEQLKGVTAHIHVSDNRGRGRDSHAPLGHGILPVAEFLRRVGTDPLSPRSLTVELDCRRHLHDTPALVRYLRREREKCAALLAGVPAQEVLGPAGPQADGDDPRIPPTAGPPSAPQADAPSGGPSEPAPASTGSHRRSGRVPGHASPEG